MAGPTNIDASKGRLVDNEEVEEQAKQANASSTSE